MEHGHSTFVPRLYRVVITCISVCTACKRGRPRYRRASPAIRTRNSRRRLFRGHTSGKPRVSQFCTFSTTGNRGQKKNREILPAIQTRKAVWPGLYGHTNSLVISKSIMKIFDKYRPTVLPMYCRPTYLLHNIHSCYFDVVLILIY